MQAAPPDLKKVRRIPLESRPLSLKSLSPIYLQSMKLERVLVRNPNKLCEGPLKSRLIGEMAMLLQEDWKSVGRHMSLQDAEKRIRENFDLNPCSAVFIRSDGEAGKLRAYSFNFGDLYETPLGLTTAFSPKLAVMGPEMHKKRMAPLMASDSQKDFISGMPKSRSLPLTRTFSPDVMHLATTILSFSFPVAPSKIEEWDSVGKGYEEFSFFQRFISKIKSVYFRMYSRRLEIVVDIIKDFTFRYGLGELDPENPFAIRGILDDVPAIYNIAEIKDPNVRQIIEALNLKAGDAVWTGGFFDFKAKVKFMFKMGTLHLYSAYMGCKGFLSQLYQLSINWYNPTQRILSYA